MLVYLVVNEREEDVVALHLPTGPLETRSGLKPALRCEPSTYQANGRWLSHCSIEVGHKTKTRRPHMQILVSCPDRKELVTGRSGS